MRILVGVMLLISTLFSFDATMEVVKKIDNTDKIVIKSKQPLDDFLQKVNKLFLSDFDLSSHFDPLEYTKFNVSTSDYLFEYDFSMDLDSNLVCDIELFNAKTNKLLLKKKFKISNREKYPFLIHKIVSDVNDFLGKDSIEWINRYVIFSKYVGKNKANIIISDYTLSYQFTLISGGLNVFPKWSDINQNAFYYTSYKRGVPTLYKFDLLSAKKEKILQSSGMIVCSDVTDDGKFILVSMAPDDQSDVYIYNTETKRIKQITQYKGIDVNAHFIDNKRISYITDILGYPNVFSIGIDGENIEQMVHHSKDNSSNDTFKNYIVYSSRDKKSEFGRNTFNLYLISTKTDFVRPLTSVGQNMYPRFSYDGSHILFIKHLNSQSALMILDLGTNRSYMFPLKVGRLQSIDW